MGHLTYRPASVSMFRWNRSKQSPGGVRGVLLSATIYWTVGGLLGADTQLEPTRLRCDFDAAKAGISWLSWDTEGGPRTDVNLLRSNQLVTLRIRRGDSWTSSCELPVKSASLNAGGRVYRLTVGPDAELLWSISPMPASLSMTVSFDGSPPPIDALQLVIPLDPTVTPTTVLPSGWGDDGVLQLPGVLSAPDFGQMMLRESSERPLTGRLLGSRSDKTVDLIVDLPVKHDPRQDDEPSLICELVFSPLRLPPPAGLQDSTRWCQARRGWFGAMQPSAQWGDQSRPFSAPAGILGNNVISDPASCSLWFYADQAYWTPQITPHISAMMLVRRSIDWWLAHRVRENGEVICYWDFGNFLDANAGPLIAAWDYVEASGDLDWLQRRIARLEFIAEFLARRDVDGDGLVEAVQSGNYGTLQLPARSCAWWDALNCGHKDGYTNALIYRAWRCLADLEMKLSRREQALRYQELADRLQRAYAPALMNPDTGWLGWWRSEDGQLHDYATPVVNGLAIEYGLVDATAGRAILDRLWEKIEHVGFQRFDLGIPPMLVPVLRSDYLQPNGFGIPQREDGSDTMGHYMNGGITAGQTLHFLAAHYVVGQAERGDRVLDAMLARQMRGEFQNGVQDSAGRGIDWTDWNGNPTGYEGYLADSFRFLQAVLLRDAALRARFYRPLHQRLQ